MNIRIGIHHQKRSFSDRWIEYCTEHGLPYTIVDCYDSQIMSQLASIDVLLWEFLLLPTDLLMARFVLKAAEMQGLHVFPNSATCWHYDDKVAQKYLLEAINTDFVPTHVFYDLESSLRWIDQTSFPKVFKLRRGAGSQNVKLVRSVSEAKRLARRAFGKGFRPIPGFLWDAKTKMRKHRQIGDIANVLKRLPETLSNTRRIRGAMAWEKGYIYFQDFMPDNGTDTRITVIGDRAFGLTRNVRPNDFRASGSGSINYDVGQIDMRCVEMAFQVAKQLDTQSLAFDFVRAPTGKPQILEVSYCYVAGAVYDCPGHWDSTLAWHEGHMWPQDAILEDLLAEMQ
ncbi:MAG: hypothetical protein KAV82_00610 [Phycisphaerae bacterium]|nr:hypothetical protein [Phycisphaerae bacterium]